MLLSVARIPAVAKLLLVAVLILVAMASEWDYFDWDDLDTKTEFYNEPTQYWNKSASLNQWLASMPTQQKEEWGHQLKDFLLDCQWNDVMCSPKNFTKFVSSRYGNCYTFNSGANNSTVVKTNYAGPYYGLTLELFIEQNEYLDDYPDFAGVRVAIHSQKTMPFPEDDGFNVEPGRVTSVGIRRVEVTRLPHPYTTCIKADHEGYENAYTERYGVSYSLETCMKSCYQKRVAERCRCLDGRYPPPIGNDDLHICAYSNMSAYTCLSNVGDEYRSYDLSMNCDCPQPCQ
uniref:Degenerin del-1-like n=1 Tax=Saccoglossus kowalevskii TaxID=10224 RepID=A0ABM0MG06_SACKO|nr:PREDICTED: degenerin del-1-like [Saccoglossus kowalevskii]